MTDAFGHRIALTVPPRRIVSLVPSQTELLADLGLDDEVVGLTRFCVHPAGWKARKQIIGGTKNVRLDRVAALSPDLVIANKEENVREQVEAIAEDGCPVVVTDVATVADALAMIRDVGVLVGRSTQAGALTDQIVAGFDALAREVAGAAPLQVAYLIWRDPWMTIGGDTFIHDVLHHAGLVSVFGGQTRYPVVTADDLRAAAPDLVLLSSEPYPFKPKHHQEIAAAMPGVRVHGIDGELCSWYGSRLRHTPAYLAELRRALA
ncbi:MAG: helical backbone metal receptor [Bacteroidota bacterium]